MSQTKKCAVSGEEFIVRDEDLEFYDKISPIFNDQKYLIPPPTLSPLERDRRRLVYRNERTFYKSKSDFSGQPILSLYHPQSEFTVYSKDEWWSDNWNALDYGKDFDFSRSFFDQFYELNKAVPRPPLTNNNSENSDYCNFTDYNKNCYLLVAANYNEDCYYSSWMVTNKNVVDVFWCNESELCYECIDCQNCYNLKYSQNSENCSDSAFLYDCKGVSKSFFCIGLRNKDYYFFNEPISKEKYEQILQYLQGSYSRYKEFIKRFEDFKARKNVRKAMNVRACENVVGNNIFNSQNVFMGFDVYNSRDCAYLHDGLNAIDCVDVFSFDKVEMCYESAGLMGYGYRFTINCRDSNDLFYCENCHASKYLFGCTGIRNKQYCILNKQYSEEEYNSLVPRIIEHMIARGEWGEFFPIKYSPFAYNETAAQDLYLLKPDDVGRFGAKWMDEELVSSGGVVASLPDRITDTGLEICNEVLRCEVTGKSYRIIPQELRFYKMMQLPFPRKCPDQRFYERMSSRNPRELWGVQCSRCGVQVKSVWDPSGPERVVCEKCYFEEVY